MMKVAFIEDTTADISRIQTLFDQNKDRFESRHYPDYEHIGKRIAEFNPKVMLLDIGIGKEREAGINAIDVIKKVAPRVKIIMLTDIIEHVQRAFQKGADGYIMKDEIRHSLDFIEDVAMGVVLSPKVVEKLIADVMVKEYITLTATEERIICYSACDMGVMDITAELNKTKNTITKYAVESYIRGIKIKLDCNTIQGVVGKCLYYNLVDVSAYFKQT